MNLKEYIKENAIALCVAIFLILLVPFIYYYGLRPELTMYRNNNKIKAELHLPPP